jgi:flagellar biosynthesis protein FlhB
LFGTIGFSWFGFVGSNWADLFSLKVLFFGFCMIFFFFLCVGFFLFIFYFLYETVALRLTSMNIIRESMDMWTDLFVIYVLRELWKILIVYVYAFSLVLGSCDVCQRYGNNRNSPSCFTK